MASAMAAFLERAVKHYEDTGELGKGSTSELLMVAFAIGRWDLVSDIQSQFQDPLNAWFYRLNQAQRDAVLVHRPDLAEFIKNMKA